MNENHRKLILGNIDQLAGETDYRTILQACLDKRIITDVMAEIIDTDGSDDLNKSNLLFRKLTHRGPTAFLKILDILKDNKYSNAHKLLSASTIPSATFYNEDVVIDKENSLSISQTTRINRTNSYSPPRPVTRSNNNSSDDQADCQVVTSTEGPNFLCWGKPKRTKVAPYNEKTSFQFDLNLEVKKAAEYGTHQKLQVYSMKSKKRGVFLFINIIQFRDAEKTRRGAEKDRDNLITLFRQMNYSVFYYEDLTRQEFYELMSSLKDSEYLKQVDSFVCCIQTHGDLDNNRTIMEFSDGLTVGVEMVIETFSNTSCLSLVGKPKVFFFPFCRGSISDKEKKVASLIETDGFQNGEKLVPTFSDILICYGTVPGFMTHRDTGFGSWYVREMCKIFAEHACDCHIEELLKMVGTKTLEIRDSGRLQVASTESRGFNKLLFFNPKISD